MISKTELKIYYHYNETETEPSFETNEFSTNNNIIACNNDNYMCKL